jgi:hypothetical protein
VRAAPILVALCVAAPAWAGRCAAHSTARTTALVELYTSAACSGCPAAERWLSALGERFAGRVVAVALHVDYWDYLAEDPSAARRSSARQRKLLLQQRTALVFTPQVKLQGGDFRAWDSAAFEAAVASIHARPAAAWLSLEIRDAAPSGLSVLVEGRVLDSGQQAEGALYLAAFESRPRGESVILEWGGPLAVGADGRFAEARRLALPPSAVPATSGVAAFVQNRRTGEVLQALLLPACSP